MSGRRFLALDQSPSSTGYALWEDGFDLPVSGAWPLCSGTATRHLGFVAIHTSIGTLHKEKRITDLAYEQPIKRPSDKVENLIALYGVAAHIESIAYVKGITNPLRIKQGDWRATWLGPKTHGRGREALKRLAIERARHYGMDPETDDEAEAIGILDHMLLLNKIIAPWRMAHPFLPML